MPEHDVTVILTGTGTPLPDAHRAGAGVLVDAGGQRLQFDAGRATAMRLAAVDLHAPSLDAVFLTHHHSDHLLGLADLVLSRWLWHSDAPLTIVAPDGPAAAFAETVLEAWRDDIAVRVDHQDRRPPSVTVRRFPVVDEPCEVWDHAGVRVIGTPVRHEPVQPAVGYRVEHAGRAVVISGDTTVCPEIEQLAWGCDVLVHEACRADLLRSTSFGSITDYHADTVKLGAMAARLDVPLLVLTHLIPGPTTAEEESGFVADIRRGGYAGEVIVGRDLWRRSW
jgi:ribonuclease Z